MSFELLQGDCVQVMAAMPADSVDLTFFSPPYEDARSYSIDFSLAGQQWVDWMVQVFTEAQRVCKGLVACVCQGRTQNYRWSAVPALLVADLHRAGFNLRNPPIFHRVGIPGSGGPDWLRGDYEWIICTARPGKLPFSDNTSCGHPPKWAPGGEMSHRVSDGSLVNQWGHPIESGATVTDGDGNTTSKGKRPSHKFMSMSSRGKDGERKMAGGRAVKTGAVCGKKNGDTDQNGIYDPPVLANPGNSIERSYTATEVAEFLQLEADYRHHIVGGGVMGGDEFSSQNEAPFPEALPEFFIRSFCPENGRVLDPTCGSGTTLAVAHRWKRHGVGIDIRASQIDLATKRLEAETPFMFA